MGESDGQRRNSWICRDDAERDRFFDMHRRLAPASLWSLAVLGAVLAPALPQLNPWSLIPIAVGIAAQGATLATLTRRRRPELAILMALALAAALMTTAIVINGHQHNGDLALLLWPVVGVCAGFAPRVAYAFTAYTGLLMVGATTLFGGHVVAADPSRLAVPVGMLLAITILVSAMQDSDIHHRGAAVVDALTGMFNRGALETRAAELLHLSVISEQQVAVIVGDIDHFKAINDEHCHDAGDSVLRDVAYILRKQLRKTDMAYRVGGEEFMMLLVGAGAAEAQAKAERMRVAVSDLPVAGMPVTMSFGVAASAPGEPFVYRTVFAAADAALFAAKRAGRDRVVNGARARTKIAA